MQFTVNLQDFLDGLNTVTRALAARPARQILEGILMVATNGMVTMTCSDGSLAIQSFITADVKEEGSTVMPGRLFTELCRKLPGGEVTIRVGDAPTASIRCMSSRSNIAVMNAAEYPEVAELGEGITINVSQKKLKDMISHVTFAIANDENRQVLTGCLMEVNPEEIRLVTLDGFRLAMQRMEKHFELPEDKPQLKAVIPGRVMNEMSKILPDEETDCTLLLTNTHMQASFGNTRLTTVQLAGEYIDYRKILPPSFKTVAYADRNAVQNAIDRASLMARESKNNMIRMSFKENSLAITSNAEMGDVLEEMEAELQGDPIDIAFNAKFITDVIRNISESKLCMHFNSAVSPCVVKPEEGDGYLYLILPVRVFS